MTDTENTAPPVDSPRFSALRALLETFGILVISFVGLVLGGLTGWIPMGPIVGMLLPLVAATLLLRREGRSWRDLGFPRSMPWRHFIGYTIAAITAVYVVSYLVVDVLLGAFGIPVADLSLLTDILEDNLTNYIVFMVFIVWGSAAFGEELIARGFILDRLSKVFGMHAAVIVQAGIFGMAHFYQGLAGIVSTFVVAVVFSIVYVRCGRNLWPVIVAHGMIDTFGITLIYLGHTDFLTGSG